MDRMHLEEAVAKYGKKTSNGKVLVVLAASGAVLRYRGVFFYMLLDESNAAPAVFMDGAVIAIDPRAMVYDDGNLARLYAPRDHMGVNANTGRSSASSIVGPAIL